MSASYSERFYGEMQDANLTSARAVAPLVMSLVGPSSIVDVGCGEGLWLKAFAEAGAEVRGVDGAWVNVDRLAIPKDRFAVCDLEQPFELGSADLAMSLEVAEHLPDAVADSFIASLTSIAPVILFSAAIPLQGGSHHVNEQWPEYWEKKFRARGYVPVDAVRRHVWDDERVSFFYAQNILLYVKESELSKYSKLQEEIASGHGKALSLVHPFIFKYYAERWRMVVPFLGKLPVGFLHAVKRFLRN